MSEDASADNELSALPTGSIVRRKIRGIYRFYHQWREGGKTKSRYLKPGEVIPLRRQIERRKAMSKTQRVQTPDAEPPLRCGFAADILSGRELLEFAHGIESWKPRRFLPRMLEFARSETSDRVLLLSGHSGTGKTTLMRHALLQLSDEERDATAYFAPPPNCKCTELNDALSELRRRGVRRVFLDGLRDPGALGGTGLKIVAADAGRSPCDPPPSAPSRFRVADLSFISFAEHARLTGETDVLGYLERGGSLEFADAAPAAAFASSDRAIDAFLLDALGCASAKPREARRRQEAFVGNDIQKLAKMLCGGEDDDTGEMRERVLATPPFWRLRRSLSRVDELLGGAGFALMGAAERKLVRDAALEAVRERMVEDVVWKELAEANAGGRARVERVRFAPGAYGIVVADAAELTCEVRAVFAGAEREARQLRYLDDPLRMEDLGHRYGFVTAREVLYEGRNARHPSGVSYRNLEKFLLGLG